MKIEEFKKMMENRFSVNGKTPKVIVETDNLVQMEVDISLPVIPMKLIDDLYWRKDEVDFCKSLENEQVEFMGYYHRVSRATAFNQRNFYFLITGKDGEKYPNYMSIYIEENGCIKLSGEGDFFFPRNEKQNDTPDVLREEVRILKSLQSYLEANLPEENKKIGKTM